MIQRPQTLFLLGAAILLFTSTMVPLWQLERLGVVAVDIDAFKMTIGGKSFSTVYLASISIVSSLVALVSIFLYKNRKNQLKLGLLNMVFILVYALVLVFKTIPDAGKIVGAAAEKGSYGLGVFMIIGALILNFLASRFIRKDEELVRSVDRIR